MLDGILAVVRIERIEQLAQNAGPAPAFPSGLAGAGTERLVLVTAEGCIGQLVVADGQLPGTAAAGDGSEQHPDGSDQGGDLTNEPQAQQVQSAHHELTSSACGQPLSMS